MENAKLVFGGRLILLLCTEVVLYEMLLEASRLLTLFYRYTCSNDICYPFFKDRQATEWYQILVNCSLPSLIF